MRSRYTAYCQENVDYLIATHHPSKRKFDERIQLLNNFKTTTWVKLTVVNVSQGKPTDEVGYVEFVAVYRANELSQLHERSKFIRESGQWFYLSGDILPPLLPKRNEPCWCGSGRKYKQCHGR